MSLSPFYRLKRSPIRSRAKPDRITKDGRLVLGKQGYANFRKVMCELAGEFCKKCRRYTPLAMGHVHHRYGRGGGRRDDLPTKCDWLCSDCHRKEHGQ